MLLDIRELEQVIRREIEGVGSMKQEEDPLSRAPLAQISPASQDLVVARWMEVTVIFDLVNNLLYRVVEEQENLVLYTHKPQEGFGRRVLLKLFPILGIFGQRLQRGAMAIDTQESLTIFSRLGASDINISAYVWRGWFPGLNLPQNDFLRMDWRKTRWQGITMSGVGIAIILLGVFTRWHILLLVVLGVFLGVIWWVGMILDKSIEATWRKKGLIK